MAIAIGIGFGVGYGGGIVIGSDPILPNYTLNVAYATTLHGSGGTAPYTFANTPSAGDGVIPPGLSLSGAVISGTPVGYTYTYQTSGFPPTGQLRATVSGGTVGLLFNKTASSGPSPGGGAGPGAPPYILFPPGITLAYGKLIDNTNGGEISFSFTGFAFGGTAPNNLNYSISGGVLLAQNNWAPALNDSITVVLSPSYFLIHLTDANGSTGVSAYTIGTVIIVTPVVALPPTTVNVPYTTMVSGQGGTPPLTASISSGTLPTGLTLASTGVVSGTPSVAGSFSVTIAFTDVLSILGTEGYTHVINAALAFTTGSPLPDAAKSVAYTQTLATSGGTAPVTFALTAGTLPGGLALSTAGVITGTPSATGTSAFTITATDSVGATASQAYSLDVALSENTVTITVTDSQGATAAKTYVLGVNDTADTTGTLLANVALAASPNPSVNNASVTFTAVVVPFTSGGALPTGTVTFSVDAVVKSIVTLTNGLATYSQTLATGTHTILATYNGSGTYIGGTSSTLTQSVTASFTQPWRPNGAGVFNALNNSITSTNIKGDGSTNDAANMYTLIQSIPSGGVLDLQGANGATVTYKLAGGTGVVEYQTFNWDGASPGSFTLTVATAAGSTATTASITVPPLPLVGGSGTSTTSITVGNGAHTFTTQSGLGSIFAASVPVLVYETSAPANWMLGTVTSYSGTTLVMNAATSGGSGTLTDWTIVSVSYLQFLVNTQSAIDTALGTANLVIAGHGVSATSLVIGTGAKTFTTQTGLSTMAAAATFTAFSRSNLANSMTGTITSYNSGTGSLVTSVTSVTGGGTITDWTIVVQQTGNALISASTPQGSSGVPLTYSGTGFTGKPQSVCSSASALFAPYRNLGGGCIDLDNWGTALTGSFAKALGVNIQGAVNSDGTPAAILDASATANLSTLFLNSGHAMSISGVGIKASTTGGYALWGQFGGSFICQNFSLSGFWGARVGAYGFFRNGTVTGPGASSAGSIGLMFGGEMMDSLTITAFETGFTAYSGPVSSLIRSTVTHCKKGYVIGTNENGHNNGGQRGSVNNNVFSTNDYDVYLNSANNIAIANNSHTGSAGSPSGGSIAGIYSGTAAFNSIQSETIAGSYSTAGIYMSNAASQTTIYNTLGTNSGGPLVSIDAAAASAHCVNLGLGVLPNPATTTVNDNTALLVSLGNWNVINVLTSTPALVDDNATDNLVNTNTLILAALQTYNSTGQPPLFYYPGTGSGAGATGHGQYKYSAAPNFNQLPILAIVGDGSSSGGDTSGSSILSSSGFATPILNLDFSTTYGIGMCVVKNINIITQAGNTAGVFLKNAALSTLQNIQTGTVWRVNCQYCNTSLIGGTFIDEQCNYCSAELMNANLGATGTGLQACGSNLHYYACRFEVNAIAYNLGFDHTGTAAALTNSTFMACDGESNSYWTVLSASCSNLIFAGNGADGLHSSTTSTTSLTVNTGSQSLTVGTGLSGNSFVTGASIAIFETATPGNFMVGTITSYNNGTGALVVNVTSIGGSGTHTDWSVFTMITGTTVPSGANQIVFAACEVGGNYGFGGAMNIGSGATNVLCSGCNCTANGVQSWNINGSPATPTGGTDNFSGPVQLVSCH